MKEYIFHVPVCGYPGSRVFLIFLQMRELRESRAAVNKSHDSYLLLSEKKNQEKSLGPG